MFARTKRCFSLSPRGKPLKSDIQRHQFVQKASVGGSSGLNCSSKRYSVIHYGQDPSGVFQAGQPKIGLRRGLFAVCCLRFADGATCVEARSITCALDDNLIAAIPTLSVENTASFVLKVRRTAHNTVGQVRFYLSVDDICCC